MKEGLKSKIQESYGEILEDSLIEEIAEVSMYNKIEKGNI